MLRRPVRGGRRMPFVRFRSLGKNEGSRAPEGAGAERRTRGVPRGHACLRIARDAQPMTRAGRASRRSAAALGIASRLCLSSGPCLRVPAIRPVRQRAPRTGVLVPPGRVPKPPGSPADNRDPQAPRQRMLLRIRPGTAWLISARASRPLHQAASPVDAPRRARPVQDGEGVGQGKGGKLSKI